MLQPHTSIKHQDLHALRGPPVQSHFKPISLMGRDAYPYEASKAQHPTNSFIGHHSTCRPLDRLTKLEYCRSAIHSKAHAEELPQPPSRPRQTAGGLGSEQGHHCPLRGASLLQYCARCWATSLHPSALSWLRPAPRNTAASRGLLPPSAPFASQQGRAARSPPAPPPVHLGRSPAAPWPGGGT